MQVAGNAYRQPSQQELVVGDRKLPWFHGERRGREQEPFVSRAPLHEITAPLRAPSHSRSMTAAARACSVQPALAADKAYTWVVRFGLSVLSMPL